MPFLLTFHFVPTFDSKLSRWLVNYCFLRK